MSVGTKVKGTISLVFLAPIVFWTLTHFMPGMFSSQMFDGDSPNPHADHKAYSNPYSFSVVWEPANRHVKILYRAGLVFGEAFAEEDRSPWSRSFNAAPGDTIYIQATQQPTFTRVAGKLTCIIYKGGEVVDEHSITEYGTVECRTITT